MTRIHWLLALAALAALAAAALWPVREEHAPNTTRVTTVAAAPGAAPRVRGMQPHGATTPGRRAPRLLAWEDLVPPNYRPEDVLGDTSGLTELQDSDPRAIALLASLRKAYDEAPLVAALNGIYVKMPGYAIPLEQVNGRTQSFLLVPFYGACIHEPPPPANQIVHVTVPGGTIIRTAFEVVWATGVMSAQRTGTRLATAGYLIRAEMVEPYRVEDDPNA